MKIASWNVNSLRARLPHLEEWLKVAQPDVVALQEIKVEDEKFPRAEIEALVLGASIGYFSGKLITSAHQAQKSTTSTSLRLYPTMGGVGCTYQF